MATEIFPLEVWTSQITQASVPANENSLRVQVLEQSSEGVESVQPVSPEDDQIYILGASPSGDQWGNFSQWDVVIFKGGAWLAFSPFEGWMKTVSGVPYLFSSGAWAPLSVPAVVSPPEVTEITDSTVLSKINHSGKFLECSSSDPITLTVSDDTTEDWDDSTEIHVRMAGTGMITFDEASGVTIQKPATVNSAINEQFGVATLKRVGPDTWALFGLLQEVTL